MAARPTVTYITMVWWPRVKYKNSRTEINKLQRLVGLSTGAMGMAPADETKSFWDSLSSS
jgi:hypothetical protein